MFLPDRSVLWSMALACMLAGPGWAGIAQWEFNDSLAASTGQPDLIPVGFPGQAGAPGVTYENSVIGGSNARVARVTDGTALVVLHGLPSNGGGAYLNQYTLILDVKFPVIDWTSIYQTNESYDAGLGQFDLSNGNDGDWFLRPSGGIGIDGNYGGVITADTWHRLALVVDLVAGTYTGYIDGLQVQQNTGQGLDGRYALYSSTSPDPYNWFLLFADETDATEMGEVVINSFQFQDRALTAVEIAAFGGPTALGIGVAPPAPCSVDLFSENFDAVAADADLITAGWSITKTGPEEADWTTTNPCGRRNPPTANGTPSTGKFIISDSDCADTSGAGEGTGETYDIVTPAFSTADAATVWLHASASAQLNNSDDAIFDVDVSIDGGTTFTNVFRRVSPGTGRAAAPVPDTTNADGFFGRLSVDLSALAAHQASVKVRFRQFEPSDDWWVALDDIRVSCQGPPAAGNCTILAKQDFSSGLGSMTAVSLAGNAGTATWNTSDPSIRYVAGSVGSNSGRGVNRINQPNASTAFAILETKVAAASYDEYLVSPVLNCANFSDVILQFESETVLKDVTTQEVLLSLDGGVTYPTTIFSYNQAGGANNALFDDGEDSFYAARSFSLPAAVGQSNVVIAFHLKSTQGQQFWALDNIEVTGKAPVCDPRACGERKFSVSYDAGTNKVNGSWSLLPLDSGFRVLEGARIVADNLSATTTSFVDSTPPAGGAAVKYSLECYVAGPVLDRVCQSQEIQTFTCPAGLASRVDQTAKAVHLSWTRGVNLDSSGYEIRRNGSVIATVALSESSYTDSPPLTSGELNPFTYDLAVAGNDIGKCPGLSTRSVVSPGHVCFADDFEDYSDDVEFELGGYFLINETPDPIGRPGELATWTITNPGTRTNPPTFDGKPSSGRFAISDSDFGDGDNGAPGSGNSNDLWSPSFKTLGKTAVWLHVDCSAQLNNNGKVVIDVDVSTNGGGTWSNVYRRAAPARTEAPPVVDTTNSDGFFGRLDVDLSSAANKPDVKFRLRCFEASDDWWMAVDNIIVDDVAAPSGPEVIFTEDFSGGGVGSMTAVSLVGNTGNETWTTADKCTDVARSIVTAGGVFPIRDGRGVHRLEPPYAILEDECDPDSVKDDYLVTPTMDLTAYKAVYLHYRSEVCASDLAVQEVLVSLDGGTTFESAPLFSYNGGGLFDAEEEPFYAVRTLSAPQAAGQGSVSFAFHYKSPGNRKFWAIDDVRVTAKSICDPFTVAILGPTTASTGGTAHLTSSNSATGGPATHKWEVTSANGSLVGLSTVDAVDVTSPVDGPVDLKLTVTDACGNTAFTTHTVTFTQPGGGQIPGDCNQDRKVDISDAVCEFGYLFLGNPVQLPCGDGDVLTLSNVKLLDWNGDGKIDLSDGISSLNWLFVSGNPHTLDTNGDGTTCVLIAECPNSCN